MICGFADGSKRYFVLAVLSAAVSILLTFLMPQIVGFTVDSVIGAKEAALPAFLEALYEKLGGRDYLRANFVLCAVGVMAASALAGAFGYLNRLGTAKGTEGFVKRLRDTLFAHIQHLPFSWHTENQTGDIIQRCTYDVETAQRFISTQLIEVVRTFLLVALALVIMFSMNAFMAAIALAFMPILIGYSMIFYSKVGSRFREADEAEGALLAHVQENLTGVRVVRAFGRERFEIDRFDEKNDAYIGKWVSLGKTLGVFWGLGDIVSSGEMLVMTVVGSLLSVSGQITLGDFLIFLSYTTTLMWPIRQLGHILSEMSKANVSLGRIMEILDTRVEME
jgi:ATP-binding cassette subfamily B protein